MTKVKVSGAKASALERSIITSGTVGAELEFSFDASWDGLTKTAVFCCGDVILDVPESNWNGGICVIPHECLERAGEELSVGVHGVNADGSIAIPTVYVSLGNVLKGADPSGSESATPTLPVWQRLSDKIGDLGKLETGASEDLVSAINETAREAAKKDGQTLIISLMIDDDNEILDYFDFPDGNAAVALIREAISSQRNVVLDVTNVPGDWNVYLSLCKDAYTYLLFSNYEISEDGEPRLQIMRINNDGSGSYSYFVPQSSSAASLPAVGTADNGKVLKVVNGVWKAVSQ